MTYTALYSQVFKMLLWAVLVTSCYVQLLSDPDWSTRVSKQCKGYSWPFHTRGVRILFFGQNTNSNNIWNQKFDRIRIRIIFVFLEWANTNNIRAQIFGRIQIQIRVQNRTWIRIRIICYSNNIRILNTINILP